MKNKKILVFAPHADDAEIAMGGTIAKLAKNNKVTIVTAIIPIENILGKKNGYMIDWKEFEKQSLDYTINTLSIASPFSLEEKQALLETKSLEKRKSKLQEILNTYMLDSFRNTTIQ